MSLSLCVLNLMYSDMTLNSYLSACPTVTFFVFFGEILNTYLISWLIFTAMFIWKCRIWGEQGQAALEKSSICLLNCGPTGSETLKNLVLGGVGSITVVDGSKVEVGDLGNNFLGTFSYCWVLVVFCVCVSLIDLIFSVLFFCSGWIKPWAVKGKMCMLISSRAERCS